MKISILTVKASRLVMVLTILSSCSNHGNNKMYLGKVVENLEKIESATYWSKGEAWAPGDTAASFVNVHYVREYNNPADTTIGASYVKLLPEDTTRMTFCYDGCMRASVYEDTKTIVVDSFSVRKLPFRPLTPPFFNYAKNILRYALTTGDSISLRVEEQDTSTYICLTIFGTRQVEFFGKHFYIEENPYMTGETTSKYEIWTGKSNDLPYKVRREMAHDISVESVSKVELNKSTIKNFKASRYFMPGYEIRKYGEGNNTGDMHDLVGKRAPGWTLKDATGKTISLDALKSEVVMIQFTSVSCGPCKASIPFLKQLGSAYNKEGFSFVAIECTGRSMNALISYRERNDFSYPFLLSAGDVARDYQVRSFPVFFILDKNRIIRKVIRGYGTGSTDQEIRKAIDELLKI
ncbi:MAG: TlpA family protein disulfide reductase [Alphaproteobacteria bacterium]|nr:TlpA family protein disulfide reductase [Alphaproteobacteria bacterium]